MNRTNLAVNIGKNILARLIEAPAPSETKTRYQIWVEKQTGPKPQKDQKENFQIVSKYLKPEDFIKPELVKIAGLIWDMLREDEKLTIDTLALKIIDSGEAAKLAYYVPDIISFIYSEDRGLSALCEVLKKESQTLQLEKIHKKAAADLAKGGDPLTIAKQTEEATAEILSDNATEEEKIKDINAVANLREIYEREGIAGTATGWRNFDYFTQGFQESQYIIICGRPGMGKTSFMLSAIVEAIKEGKRVLFFSLEMPALKLKQRLIQIIAEVPIDLVYRKTIKGRHWDKLEAAEKLIDNSNFEIVENCHNIYAIQNRIQEEKKFGLELALIDYLQLCTSDAKNFGNREQEVADISRQIKLTCNKQKVCIIAGSQIGRPQNNGGIPAPPRLSTLRESGSLEQDANVVLALHNKAYYITGEEKKSLDIDTLQKTEVHTLKFRGGSLEVYEFRWLARITKFQEWETKLPDYLDDFPADDIGDNYNNDDINNTPTNDDKEDLPF